MRLSLIDQSAIYGESSSTQALNRTIELAQLAEELGYHRFWVSEHHCSKIFASSSPEVLLGAIGASTHQIRIGSGGVMLPHYSPYKVAENFSVLSNLYPNRVDLGIGRAPGTDMTTARALATDGQPKFDKFSELAQDLSDYLNQKKKPLVTPQSKSEIPLWMLGTSKNSALLAAKLNLPYAIGSFVNPMLELNLANIYKNNFQSSETKPYSLLALICICSEDQNYLDLLEKSIVLTYLDLFMGRTLKKMPPPEEIAKKQLILPPSTLKDFINQSYIFSTPENIKEKLEVKAKLFNVNELMIMSPTFYKKDQFDSVKLIAHAFK